MDGVDLRPATRYLSDVGARVSDGQLAAVTPCGGSRGAALRDPIGGCAGAFAAAAAKNVGERTSTPPAPDGNRLSATWRSDIPPKLETLGSAWAEPAAWEGMTRVGGIDLPGAVAGLIALHEVVLHGWDL